MSHGHPVAIGTSGPRGLVQRHTVAGLSLHKAWALGGWAGADPGLQGALTGLSAAAGGAGGQEVTASIQGDVWSTGTCLWEI